MIRSSGVTNPVREPDLSAIKKKYFKSVSLAFTTCVANIAQHLYTAWLNSKDSICKSKCDYTSIQVSTRHTSCTYPHECFRLMKPGCSGREVVIAKDVIVIILTIIFREQALLTEEVVGLKNHWLTDLQGEYALV